jgi:hypothetical protein
MRRESIRSASIRINHHERADYRQEWESFEDKGCFVGAVA